MTNPTIPPNSVNALEGDYDVDLSKLFTEHTISVKKKPAPIPPPPPTPAFPAKTADMFYYQHLDAPVKLWQYGEQPPADGTLHINIANSIDGQNDKPNSPTVGCQWCPYPPGSDGSDGSENGQAMGLWWNHKYGSSAGTRAVFSRDGWKPNGLLAWKGKTIYALIDFMAPTIPVMTGGGGLWCTWPFQYKGHDPYDQATIQANIDSDDHLFWATAYSNVTFNLMERKQLFPGKLHRLMLEIAPFYDRARGRFQGWLDGTQVVDAVGQMAFLPTGFWGETGTFCPCLYGNAMQSRMDGYIPNLILSTAPIFVV